MSNLHFDKVLGQEHQEVFGLLGAFSRVGKLGGGTALALQLGHRKSFDFDILTEKPLAKSVLLKARDVFGQKIKILEDSSNELSFATGQKIKVSFVYFPFPPLHKPVSTSFLSLFNLKDLASNKAYVIGRRGEYRDYVDMFFLLKSGLKLKEIVKEAEIRFEGAFSEKLFLGQLVWFGDLKDFTVSFVGKKYSTREVRKFLEKSTASYVKNVALLDSTV